MSRYFYTCDIWTSKLSIYADKEIYDEVIDDIKSLLDEIEYSYSKFPISDNNRFKNKELTNPRIDTIYEHTAMTSNYIAKIINYDSKDGGNDFTCMLKGYALKVISDLLIDDYAFDSFYINFGGDILIHNVASKVKIENTNFFINTVRDRYCIFTSGNTSKRGNHIIFNEEHKDNNDSLKENSPSILTTLWIDHIDPIASDAITTRLYGGFHEEFYPESETNGNDINNLVALLTFKEDGTCILPKVYCASPFFNEYEIKVRDKMVSKFQNIFRPDQTESSKSYDLSPGRELAQKIYDDNIEHLKDCNVIVFPEGTNDLGTLYEVGYSIGLCSKESYISKSIIRYNYDLDEYYIVDICSLIQKFRNTRLHSENSIPIIDCSEVSGAILCGYLDAMNQDYKYYVGNLNDNIMLSIRHTRVGEAGNDMAAKYEVGM